MTDLYARIVWVTLLVPQQKYGCTSNKSNEQGDYE